MGKKEERLFFSEEKKQKTFVHWRMRSPEPTRQSPKVFWFFFSKKNILPLLLAQLAFAAFAAPPPQVTITGAWARATLPHQDNTAVYMTLQSQGGDLLAGVSSPEAGMAMLHKNTMHGSMESMDDMESVKLPAHQPVVFAPKGMHIMLMDLKHALKPGDTVHVQLQLAHGTQDVDVPVRPITAHGP
jgi:copper(I)-binding protein